jgi:hypothetical protein
MNHLKEKIQYINELLSRACLNSITYYLSKPYLGQMG